MRSMSYDTCQMDMFTLQLFLTSKYSRPIAYSIRKTDQITKTEL